VLARSKPLGDLGRFEIARMFIVDFLQGGVEAQAGLSDQVLLISA
jgi:hypothetical protein